MMDGNSTYRIRTGIDGDSHLTVSLNQDFDVLEVLSLKIGRKELYRLHTSDYGCVVGRVLANGGFGIPNAKVSVFIAADSNISEDTIFASMYPYSTAFDKNGDGVRYNLLTEEQISDCHRNVGTFPSKRRVLDDSNVLEVFDNYYKFTTTTNNSGDYMIFGVPVGNQVIHTDIDLSNIGILSQKPRDMMYKGYSRTQFENPDRFKAGTDLDNLVQIISQNDPVDVFPFWGEESEGEVRITRNDINMNYKFEPTCIFLGSVVTDDKSSGISKKCIPSDMVGKMDQLTTGSGTIEMIRKTTDGSVEEYSVMGNQLIDGNGTWCYQIPMNLDYMATDEYGNMVPTDNPEKGIPTRARVRFRVSIDNSENDYGYLHVGKALIPHNPQTRNGFDYVFGTNTKDNEEGSESFRDLLWNNVYTVKSYIPRFQSSIVYKRNRKFSGFKDISNHGGNNPIPYNNMRVRPNFMFVVLCALFNFMIWLANAWNTCLSWLYKILDRLADKLNGEAKWTDDGLKGIGSRCADLGVSLKAITFGEDFCPEMEGWYFAPGADNSFEAIWEQCYERSNLRGWVGTFLKQALRQKMDGEGEGATDLSSADSTEEQTAGPCITNNMNHFIQCVEINLAMEYGVIQFDFYNDWINGLVYLPRWYAGIRKKRTYLFGLISSPAKVYGCLEGSKGVSIRRFVQSCTLRYTKETGNGEIYNKVMTSQSCDKGTKCIDNQGVGVVKIFRNKMGVVHDELNMDKKHIYYMKPAEWTQNNKKCNLYATDIVLLGSVDDCSIYGIPKIDDSLESSTYLLPPALASTNLDKEGPLYGVSDSTRVCANNISDGVKQTRNSFTTQQAYDRDATPADSTEYEVTEEAGIDWGYSGPDQNGNSGDVSKVYSAYNPGGHFLSKGCFRTLTSVKTCVNLSRICEVGVGTSQRHMVPRATSSEGGESWAYLIPTGLIAKDDIEDGNFRKMFATLNGNGLRTVMDSETGLRRYSFVPFMPSNFGGELRDDVKGDSRYNQRYTGNEKADSEFRRTIESVSNDYYLFRMGGTGKDYFLSSAGNTVAMPMYNNSFYFYFGLSDGNSAIDRFKSELYGGGCPSLEQYVGTIDVDVTKFSDRCDPKGGKVNVSLSDVEGPFSVYLIYSDGENHERYLTLASERSGGTTTVYPYGESLVQPDKPLRLDYMSFSIRGLGNGIYRLQIFDANNEWTESTFTIDEAYPSLLSGVSIDKYDFTKDYSIRFDETEADRADNITNGGYLTIVGVRSGDTVDGLTLSSITIMTSDRYSVLFGEAAEATVVGERKEVKVYPGYADGGDRAYCWQSNAYYTVVFGVLCPDDVAMGKVVYYEAEPVFVGKSGGVAEAYFTDVTVTESALAKKGVDVKADKWWLKNNNLREFTELSEFERWALKKALFFSGSVHAHDSMDIGVGVTGGVAPYSYYSSGNKYTEYSATDDNSLYLVGGNVPYDTIVRADDTYQTFVSNRVAYKVDNDTLIKDVRIPYVREMSDDFEDFGTDGKLTRSAIDGSYKSYTDLPFSRDRGNIPSRTLRTSFVRRNSYYNYVIISNPIKEHVHRFDYGDNG